MKKLFSFFILPIAILLITINTTNAQQPINVKGTWNLTVETSAGSGSPTFELKHITDSTLEGIYRGSLGETTLKGTLKANKIYIVFTVSGIDIEYNGTVDGDSMKGTVLLGTMGEGTFSGTRKK
jgi:hypothetical protein